SAGDRDGSSSGSGRTAGRERYAARGGCARRIEGRRDSAGEAGGRQADAPGEAVHRSDGNSAASAAPLSYRNTCGRRRKREVGSGSVAAIRELEVGDVGVPVERTRGLHVLGGVPEGAIVNRIHR